MNGERLQGQVVLKPGDQVSVGKLSFEIVVRDPEAVESAPATPAVSPQPTIDPAAETSVGVTDTIEIPASVPDQDTAIIGSFPPPETQIQPAMPPQGYPQYAQPAYAMPQGYGMPPGYPQGYPGYMPPAYPQGYGAPPGYMVPGYPMQPAMPMPGYGMPQAPVAEPAQTAVVEPPPVVLPDPSETGAKPVAPPPPPAPPVEGQAAAQSSKKPSEAAADIIRSHRTRRAT